jgi:hypothetical protein
LSGVGSGGTDNSAALTTFAGGLTGNVTVLPLSGFVDAPIVTTLVSGSPNFAGGNFIGAVQTLPAATTFTKMYGTLINESAMNLIGSTITVTAQLFHYTSGGSSAGVAGTTCTFAPAYTGIVAIGDVTTCSVTGFSASIPGGDGAFIVISATAAGLSLINTIQIDASIGVQ